MSNVGVSVTRLGRLLPSHTERDRVPLREPESLERLTPSQHDGDLDRDGDGARQSQKYLASARRLPTRPSKPAFHQV